MRDGMGLRKSREPAAPRGRFRTAAHVKPKAQKRNAKYRRKMNEMSEIL